MEAGEDTQRRADLELVRRVVQGDPAATLELARRLGCIPRILRQRNAKAGSPFDDHELADIAQDVLLIVWRKLKGFHGQSVLPAWAYLICTFEFQNALRRKGRVPRALGALLAAERELSQDSEPAHREDPWEYEDVHLGLRRIGTEEAHVIRLKHFKGKTFDEIARGLSLSRSTVKDRYYRGIAELEPLLATRRPRSS